MSSFSYGWIQQRAAAAQLRKGELLAALQRIAMSDPLAHRVIEHHSPTDESRRYCRGCDMGCSCEAASWPCSTIELVLEQAGIDTTDIDLIDWKGDL